MWKEGGGGVERNGGIPVMVGRELCLGRGKIPKKNKISNKKRFYLMSMNQTIQYILVFFIVWVILHIKKVFCFIVSLSF